MLVHFSNITDNDSDIIATSSFSALGVQFIWAWRLYATAFIPQPEQYQIKYIHDQSKVGCVYTVCNLRATFPKIKMLGSSIASGGGTVVVVAVIIIVITFIGIMIHNVYNIE